MRYLNRPSWAFEGGRLGRVSGQSIDLDNPLNCVARILRGPDPADRRLPQSQGVCPLDYLQTAYSSIRNDSNCGIFAAFAVPV